MNNQINLKLQNTIYAHDDTIRFISLFPSGNFISVSNDRSIKIFDINLNNIQTIKEAHNDNINYVDVKNENNFITCSYQNINFYNKISDKYILNNNIENAHNDTIYCIKYYSNEKIISCSRDKTIKIWEENNNKYQCITIIKFIIWVNSLLILEDKNILISSCPEGTILWNMNNLEIIINIKEAICYNTNILNILDEDKIIVGDDIIKVISLSEKKIVKEINNEFRCIGIYVIKEKKMFLTGGYNNNIKIYNSDIFELIHIINNAHNDWVYGFIQLKNGFIVSYGRDRTIKVWNII